MTELINQIKSVPVLFLSELAIPNWGQPTELRERVGTEGDGPNDAAVASAAALCSRYRPLQCFSHCHQGLIFP